MLAKGFNATSVDEMCEEAGVTKGSFFHYFESKEGLAKEAVNYFSNSQMQHFEAGPYNSLTDPLDRLYGFLDFMMEGVKKSEVPPSCLIGNLSQELSRTHSEIRLVCDRNFSWHNQRIQNLIEEAMKSHPPKAEVNAASLAQYLTATIEGSLILTKASQDTSLMVENIQHFKRYLQTLFEEKGGAS
jgi:TetR/AcrR family transcriptional repressor of nem operon